MIFYNHNIERKEIIQLNYEKNQMCLALNSEMKHLLIVKITKTAIYRHAKFVEFMNILDDVLSTLMFTFISFYRHIIFLIDCTHFTHAAFCIRNFKKPVRMIIRPCCSFVCLFVVVVFVVVVVYRPVSSESSLTFHTYC